MRKLSILALTAVNLFSAGFDRAESLASNAKELYSMLGNVMHSLLWVLAVIPVVLLGWAISHTMNKFKHYVESGNEHKSTVVEKMSGIVLSAVFSITSIFFIYGIFVKTYADPSGSMSFLDVWNLLVVSFWKEVLSYV